MPPVSEAQRKAMFAAKAGHSNIGIPQSVGKEFADADKGGKLPERKQGKDCIKSRAVKAGLMGEDDDLRDGSFLQNLVLTLALVDARKRAPISPMPELPREAPYGLGEGEEGPLEEEGAEDADSGVTPASPPSATPSAGSAGSTGSAPASGSGYEFSGMSNGSMTPGSSVSGGPTNDAKRLAQDSLAFDKGSVRSYDESGHLRVERTPISRAIVSDYLGKEIPDEDGSLGLESDKIYPLYRDAGELEKAASSFAGKPIMLRHEPISADDHPRDLVVGAIGEPVKFEGDALTAPLTIWDKEAIDKINNGSLKDLSCGYFYRPIMESGTAPDGKSFAGRMTAISGNHLALVENGRVPGAYVADSGDTLKGKEMAKRKTGASPAVLAKALGKIAAMDEAALTKLLSALEDKPVEGKDGEGDYTPMETRPGGTNAASAPGGMFSEGGEGNTGPGAGGNSGGETFNGSTEGEDEDGPDPFAEIRKFLAGKLSDEDIAQLDELIGAIAKGSPEPEPEAMGEEPAAEMKPELPVEEKKEEPVGDSDDEDEKEKDEKDMVTKPAMDAAISAAVAAERRRQKDIREAEEAVRPVVGKLIAQDSAEAVYREACKLLGKDVSAVKDSAALPILFREFASARKATAYAPVRPAMDAAAIDSFDKLYPDAKRIRIG